MNNFLEIKNLSISFPGNHLVNTLSNCNLKLDKNGSLGIVGESGSGKTLSMLALTRLLPKQAIVSSGSIDFLNHNLSEIDNLNFYKNFSGKKVSMIFQEPMTALNPVYTIGRQLMHTYMYHNKVGKKEAHHKSLEMLSAVKLSDNLERMKQFPHQLSGGQRQRVMIAMALINNPSLLIADEPTTALDVTVQKEIINLIQELKEKFGMALIFISHDLGVVSQVSKNIIVMKRGEIIETGKTYNVLNKPKKLYTKTLISCLKNLNTKRKKNKSKKNDKIIEVTNLSKFYKLPSKLFSAKKIINAVNDINFSVYEGETLSIIGESGSGKSTVAKMLNGLLAPDRGEILICNKDINKLDTKERAEIIQPVFQDPYSTLNPNHTIGYIIARPLILNKPFLSDEIRNLVLKTLDLVGLDKGFYYRFPNQLSGGQRQRVAIARAIILEPKILICDEPTSSLDVTIQEQILQLLKDLKQKLGITIILISHDISVVKYLSERVLVMLDGKIVESGDTISTLQNPKKEYTKKLMSAVYEI